VSHASYRAETPHHFPISGQRCWCGLDLPHVWCGGFYGPNHACWRCEPQQRLEVDYGTTEAAS
jgi:hypothetical protein